MGTLRPILSHPVSRNAAALYAQQLGLILLPLVTIPYLVRVLGVEGYGSVAFGQGLVAYFAVAVDYGFAWSATRRISVNRRDLRAVGGIAAGVWAAKLALFVIGAVMLACLILAVARLRSWASLLLLLYASLLGNVLFPGWLFQGMEQLGAPTAVALTWRVLTVVAIFLLVRRPDDVHVYAAILAAAGIATGITGFLVARRMFRLPPVLPRVEEVREALREGWTLFVSNAAVTVYTAGNAFVLGMLGTPPAVGYYSAAERIVRGVTALPAPLSLALYPALSRLAASSPAAAVRWSGRLLTVMATIGLLLSAIIFATAPRIVTMVLGPGFAPAVTPLRVLAVLPVLVGISNVLGVQTLLPFGRDRAFTAILVAAGALNILLAVVLVPAWQQTGMAAAVAASELFVVLAMALYLRLTPAMRGVSHGLGATDVDIRPAGMAG